MTMDLAVMEKKYYKEDMDPLESNTTMLREQMADKNVRCEANQETMKL